MCLIINQPAGSEPIERETFRLAWMENADGAGYMFAHAGKVVIRKPFFKLRHLIRAYTADHARYGNASDFVVHFRWATHGSKTSGNTHPHVVIPDTVAVAHNGVFKIDIPKHCDMSDTVAFVQQKLAPLPWHVLMDEHFADYLAGEIGGNKLVLLDAEGTTSIVNETCGEWQGGMWYSNMRWQDDYSTPIRLPMTCGKLFSTPPPTLSLQDEWEELYCRKANGGYLSLEEWGRLEDLNEQFGGWPHD